MATTNNDSQDKLNAALATLKAGGSVPISKTSAARQVNGQIYIYNPQVIQPFQFVGNKEKVASAVRQGKISPITKAQLSAALNPTKPTVPKPAGNAKPKKKLKEDTSTGSVGGLGFNTGNPASDDVNTLSYVGINSLESDKENGKLVKMIRSQHLNHHSGLFKTLSSHHQDILSHKYK
jgi:hypothetical protein